MATKKGKQTAVETRSVTFGKSRSSQDLTWQEEMVVRMTRGLSEELNQGLEFRGQAFPEVRARLALMEAHLLAEMHDRGPLAAATPVDTGLKSRILTKLSKLDEN